jgi:hypothetical protein
VSIRLRARPGRLVTTIAAAGAAIALAGCGTGVDAQTQEWYDPTDAANTEAEDSLDGMAVRGLKVIADGGDATVLGTFVNTGPDADEVSEILVEGEPAEVDGDLAVEPGQSVRLGPPGDATAQADGVDLEPGVLATVEISFSSAAQQELTTVVQAAEGDYADAGPQ